LPFEQAEGIQQGAFSFVRISTVEIAVGTNVYLVTSTLVTPLASDPSKSPAPKRSADDLENGRGSRHLAIVVTFVVKGEPDTDLIAGTADGLAVHSKGPGFATGEEHDVPGLHLEPIGANQARGVFHGGGREQHVLRSDV